MTADAVSTTQTADAKKRTARWPVTTVICIHSEDPNDVIMGLTLQPTDPAASPPPPLAPGPQPSGPQGLPPP